MTISQAQVVDSQFGVLNASERALPTLTLDGKSFTSIAADSINAIFTDGYPDWSRCDEIQLLRKDIVIPNPLNPRQFVSREAMASLLDSVSSKGVHTPFNVCQTQNSQEALTLSGHRRQWVSNALKADLIPCKLDPRGVLSEIQIREALIQYNEGQEKPAPMDRANSILDYMKKASINQSEVARKFGLTPSAISSILRLLTLPGDIQAAVNVSKISEAQGVAIARHPGSDREKNLLFEKVVKQDLNPRQIQAEVQKLKGGLKLTSKPSKPRGKMKERQYRLPGAFGVEIIINSNRAELTQEQILNALHEVIMTQPVEFSIHHKSNSESEPKRLVEDLPNIKDSKKDSAIERKPKEVIQTSKGSLTVASADSIKAVFVDGYPDWSQPGTVQLLFLDALVPHPLNPRKYVSRQAMETNTESIAENGLHTPFLVGRFPDDEKKGYVFGGHRRRYSCNKLGYLLVPCRIDSRQNLNEVQVREALIEDNEGQELPTPIDRAQSIQDLMLHTNFSSEQTSKRLGIPEKTIVRLLKLLELPDEIKDAVNEMKIKESVAVAISEHPGSTGQQIALSRRAILQGTTAKQIRKFYQHTRIAFDVSSKKEEGEIERTDRFWRTSGNLRIGVQVLSEIKKLDREQLVQSLQQLINQIKTKDKISNNTEAKKDAATVAKEPIKLINVSTLLPGIGSSQLELLNDLLSEISESDEKGLQILPSMVKVLSYPLNLSAMKKLRLNPSENTISSASKWLAKNGYEVKQDRKELSFIELAIYWTACFKQIQSFPNSKKQIKTSDSLDFPLDLPSFQVNLRTTVHVLYKKRSKSLREVLKAQLLTLSEAAEIGHQSSSNKSKKTLVTKDLLIAREVKFDLSLEEAVFYWRKKVKKEDITLNAFGGDKIDLTDIEGCLAHSLKTLMEANGAKATHTIAASTLKRKHIPYSQLKKSGSTSKFGNKEILDELRDNLERVKGLIKELK